MGIEAAHNSHIIHRDTKPQNIMISREGKVKIADFGIAKAATSNTITSNVMGSVHYTSPEQARGGFSDERSDIYSLGCTMFEMLTGRVPFDGETTVAIAIKHIQEEMPSPREYVSEIPVCVEQIIFKCTQKSPDRRYQSMSELIVDLKKSLITPDENFVKIISAETGGATKMISEDDIEEIKRRTDKIDLDEPMRLKDREVQKVSYSEEPYDDEDEEEEIAPVRHGGRGHAEAEPKKTAAPQEDEDEEEYDDDDMDPKMERVTTILAIVAAVIIGVLFLVLVANALGIFKSSGKSSDTDQQTEEQTEDEDKVSMISVVGLDVEDAKTKLNEIGLGTKVTKQESDEYELNQVISQSVEEGEEVEKYSTIELVVSSGSNGIEVTDVTGKSEEDAKSTLTALGFSVTVTSQYSDDVAEGLVISQDPSAGSKAENGAEITLVISSGPQSVKVSVPDLRGMTESAAKDKLKSSGLSCGTVSETYSDTVTEGCVVSQSYSPGTEVEQNTSVNIQLSAGPEKHTYKYVANLDAPSGYTSGTVTITLKGSDGDTRTFSATSFPCAVNETGFAVSSGTLTYSYSATSTQSVIDAETGEEKEEEVIEEITTSPVTVQFAQE
jgi:serine/threonine-protein kinase